MNDTSHILMPTDEQRQQLTQSITLFDTRDAELLTKTGRWRNATKAEIKSISERTERATGAR